MTPQQIEAMKLALEALELINIEFICRNGSHHKKEDRHEWDEDCPITNRWRKAITAIEEALAQPEQEPVAWLLTDKNINSLQVDSIQRLIDRLNHAHHTDLRVRINGQDEWFQADWLKHMVRAAPPQRTWVGLTNQERSECWETIPERAMKKVEAKLKEKNQ